MTFVEDGYVAEADVCVASLTFIINSLFFHVNPPLGSLPTAVAEVRFFCVSCPL